MKMFFILMLLCTAFMLKAQDLWTVYNEQNSGLPNNTVRVLAVDQLNRKWVGTDYGLAMFNDTVWTVYNVQNSILTDNTIRSIFIANDNSVWVGTMSGGLYHIEGSNWTNYTPANSGMPDYYVRSITVDSLGRKWIGTVEGLAMYDDQHWRVWTTFNSDFFSNNIASLKAGENLRMTAGTVNGGIAVFNDTVLTVFTRNNNSGIPDNSVLQIDIDSSGHYWFASPAAGIFVDWGGLDWQIFNQANSGMPVSAATCIFIDDNDVQYIGTEQNGLVKRTMPDNWEYFTFSNSGLPDNAIHAVIKDQNGLLWIGTHQEGLVSLREDITAVAYQHRDQISIYPNPANDFLKIDINDLIEMVNIYDLNGRKFLADRNNERVDISELANGTYILEIISSKAVYRKVFVKKSNP